MEITACAGKASQLSCFSSARAMSEEWKRVNDICVSNLGRILCFRTGLPFLPSINNRGYRIVARKKKRYMVHNLVAAAFLPPKPSSRFDLTIDHVNGDKSDNRPENLRWSSISDQNANRQLFERTQGVQEVQYKLDAEWITYPSMHALCQATNFNKPGILQVLRGERELHRGATFRYKPTEVIEDEEWKICMGFEVSNRGRIKNGKGTVFSPRASQFHQGYCTVSKGRTQAFVHILVINAFVGPAPSQEHTVDHINRIRDDNRAENLRWATRVEQGENRTKCLNPDRSAQSRKVVVTQLGHRTEYDSAIAASRAIGLSYDVIRAACSGKRKRCGNYIGGMQFEYL